MHLAAVISLRLLPPWLALTRDERNRRAAPLLEIAARYDDVDVDWYDADALGSGFTDWILCRFDSIERYHALWEELRDQEFFSHPFAEIVDVRLGLRNGFRRFEAGEL